MPDAASLRQSALGAEPAAALSLQWRHRGDAATLWRTLPALAHPAIVVGIGAPLAEAAGVDVPGLRPFERLRRGRFTFPATQHDLWVLVGAAAPGAAFEIGERVQAQLAPVAHLVDALPMFSYRHGRDLTGYRDGTENPTGDAAWAAALRADGSSFAFVQRWLHLRERFAALPQAERDFVIGRRESDDEELAEAPETAHIKRTAQEDFEPPAFMLRRSMPWGEPRRHGLGFIAFVDELDKVDRMLERMIGLDDGRQDALLGHSVAETGGYYYCPPAHDGRLVLPAPLRRAPAQPADEAPRPPRLRLAANGPLVVEAACRIAGLPAADTRLCRCGSSRNKPYCDGSHETTRFRAAGEVPPLDEPQVEVAPGLLVVQPIADGPLAVHGAVEIAGESGRTITRVAGPTLCRCGHSSNKPFCDGAHARHGFRADD